MKKKIALTLLIVVILLGIGGVYAYFATNAFKTDKELFFSYMTSDWLSDLKDENLKEYIKKQENNAYTNKGSIALEVQDDGSISDETLQMIKNSKITFEGKTDNSKKIAEQTLTMELAQGINIPVKVRRDGETLGIQSNLLNTKFIAVRNENLKNLLERLGADAEDVPDKIDFEESTFTESEIKELKEKYFSILDENLDEELFSKEKENDQTIIKLSMTEEKAKDVLIKIFQTIRDDETLLKKFSGVIDRDDLKQQIDDLVDELKDIEPDEKTTFEMKLSIKSKKVEKVEMNIKEGENITANILIENSQNKLSIKAYDEGDSILELQIEKETNENDVAYKIDIKTDLDTELADQEKAEIHLTVQYKNLATLDNVEENYELKLSTQDYDESNTDLKLNYTNVKQFSSNIKVEGINSENSITLNDATDDEIDELLITIYKNLGLY
ncbi:unknown [Clostridium sp. CAG:356]|nr:unknown [Clostridium sp. CAG:356]